MRSATGIAVAVGAQARTVSSRLSTRLSPKSGQSGSRTRTRRLLSATVPPLEEVTLGLPPLSPFLLPALQLPALSVEPEEVAVTERLFAPGQAPNAWPIGRIDEGAHEHGRGGKHQRDASAQESVEAVSGEADAHEPRD